MTQENPNTLDLDNFVRALFEQEPQEEHKIGLICDLENSDGSSSTDWGGVVEMLTLVFVKGLGQLYGDPKTRTFRLSQLRDEHMALMRRYFASLGLTFTLDIRPDEPRQPPGFFLRNSAAATGARPAKLADWCYRTWSEGALYHISFDQLPRPV